MTKLSISALAAAIALTFAGTAAAGDKANANANKPMTETTAPVDANHGQAVSSVAQSDDLTTDTRGEAVSTMAHSNRDFKKLDAALAAGLYRRLRRASSAHWLESAVSRTWKYFVGFAVILAIAGFAMQAYAPEAVSIGGVVAHG